MVDAKSQFSLQEKARTEAGRGFSLLELLVVIAILAIVAALLLPALSQSKEAARSAYCKNNLRQIGMGLIMYANQDGHYPYTADFSTGNLWNNSLEPFVSGSKEVFDCPSYRGNTGFTWKKDTIYYRGGSYGYNGFGSRSRHYRYHSNSELLGLGGDRSYRTQRSMRPIPASRVRFPNEMIAIGDSVDTIYGIPSYILNLKDAQDDEDARHGNGLNILFCDGHIEFLQKEDLVRKTSSARRRWNSDHRPHFTQVKTGDPSQRASSVK